MSEITARPWSVYDQSQDDGPGYGCSISSSDPKADWVAQNIYSKSDAEFIVRACNAHEEQLEALQGQAAFLRRFLEKLTNHSVFGAGQIINGYAAAEIPEWELRQRLDDCVAAIA